MAATLSSGGHPNSNMPGRRKEDDVNLVVAPTLRSHPRPGSADPGAVAYALRRDPGGTGQGHNTNYVPSSHGVRRLTPTECERLQGFPDDWTQVDWKGRPSPDSRRYAALGNAVTVPVAEWIGHRIIEADHMEVAA